MVLLQKRALWIYMIHLIFCCFRDNNVSALSVHRVDAELLRVAINP